MVASFLLWMSLSALGSANENCVSILEAVDRVEAIKAPAIAREGEPVRWFFFDSDDNIIHLSTKIYVFEKSTGEERALTTSEYAAIRPFLKPGADHPEWKNYEIRLDQKTGSFRDFRDENDADVLLVSFREAMEAGSDGHTWRGPSWPAFAQSMASGEIQPFVGVITTRGHTTASIQNAYRLFVERGHARAAPREEMIFGIHSPEVDPHFLDRGIPVNHHPERKLALLLELLDLAQSVPLKDKAAHHSFGFSDDDPDMIRFIRNQLFDEAVSGRWQNVHIHIYSTGIGTEFEDVITNKGMYRKY